MFQLILFFFSFGIQAAICAQRRINIVIHVRGFIASFMEPFHLECGANKISKMPVFIFADTTALRQSNGFI